MTVSDTGTGERIAVIGCGHVGVVTAACLAHLGHSVIGVDIDAGLVARLNDGRVPFIEPGLGELLQANLSSRRVAFTTSYEEALAGAAIIVLCVNTPAATTGAADLRNVRRAVERIGEVLAGSGARPVIVNKSTAPIGTGETIDAILNRSFPDPAHRPAIVANPEFLREGSAVHDFLHPNRIVIGAEATEDAERVAALYAALDAPVILTDRRTAEMVKYVSNAYLATRLSFVNEVARLCESLGVDVDAMLRGVTLDPRIGGQFFAPGIGYGGSCLPKDVAALLHTGECAGMAMRVLNAVQEANTGQRKHAVNCIRRMLGRLEGLTIAAWGVSFKGGSEDLRESPALDVISLLRNEGARIQVYDPSLPPGATLDLADQICAGPIDAARGAHCIAVLTDWPQLAEVDLAAARAVMMGAFIYDGRNLLERTRAESAGFTYHGIGRPPAWDAAPTPGYARSA
jgi:UDPglucose 6-dehydrogenase